MEGCRQEIYKKQLRPSREGVAESLRALHAYLVNMIQGLKDAGPPAPLYQEDEDDDEECVGPEYEYYNIPVPKVCAVDGDEWWAPGLSYPCGLPSHVHSLAVCPEFWGMTPMDRYSKLHPGSVCKNCLGPQSICCPAGFACFKRIPEGLQCSGCKEKSEEWGYPTCNVLFCTRSDSSHVKPAPQTILETATEYLGSWAMSITAEMVNVTKAQYTKLRLPRTRMECSGSPELARKPSRPSILGPKKRYPSLWNRLFPPLLTTLPISCSGFE